jgi:hypothetical protein
VESYGEESQAWPADWPGRLGLVVIDVNLLSRPNDVTAELPLASGFTRWRRIAWLKGIHHS